MRASMSLKVKAFASLKIKFWLLLIEQSKVDVQRIGICLINVKRKQTLIFKLFPRTAVNVSDFEKLYL